MPVNAPPHTHLPPIISDVSMCDTPRSDVPDSDEMYCEVLTLTLPCDINCPLGMLYRPVSPPDDSPDIGADRILASEPKHKKHRNLYWTGDI